WQDGVMADLGSLYGNDGNSWAYGINDAGQVVGASYVPFGVHPFLWQDGQMIELGILDGSSAGGAFGINDAGQVVGDLLYIDGDTGVDRAFFWDPEQGMTDLGVPTGFNFSVAIAVNTAGQVVGDAWYEEECDVGCRSDTRVAFLYSGGTMTDLNT